MQRHGAGVSETTRHKAADERPTSRRELFSAIACCVVLVWINAYVCRELFYQPTAYMNSMHGFWIALAERAGNSWFQSNWWPYWDCGIPFEWTYAPLVPALTAAWATIRGIPDAMAFQWVSGVVYCLAPVTLFVMAWRLTRTPAYSFLAGLFYSLVAPEQLLAPDGPFSLRGLRDARRLFLLSVWDDTPHLLALSLLPLTILFLVLMIKKRQLVYFMVTAILIALMSAASEFGPVEVLMTAVCLLAVYRRSEFRRNAALTLGAGALGYAMIAPFLPPSLFFAIRQASATGEYAWNRGSVVSAAVVAAGWIVLWQCLLRWTEDWRFQFFALLAYLASAAPVISRYVDTQFLPQPGRFKLEMELALALAIVFGLRLWLRRMPARTMTALFLLSLLAAGSQIVSYRRSAKNILRRGEVTQTIEYRAATWSAQNLADVRVMMPGTIAQWANAFSGVQQFSGGSWSKAYNPVQQHGRNAIYSGGQTIEEDARVSLAWLQAYGVSAVGVSGKNSQEFWKPYSHPAKWEGILPVLWRADDVTIYRVPQRSGSLAHVVPASAIVTDAPKEATDTAEIDHYRSALADPSMPEAAFAWEDRNVIRIRTNLSGAQALSIQVSYHPGWHATVAGRPIELRRDGLGLMWLKPACQGACDVRLDYDGGWELRLCRLASAAAIFLAMVTLLAMTGLRLRRQVQPRPH